MKAHIASKAEKEEIRAYGTEFSRLFGYDVEMLLDGTFTVLAADSSNPYHQLYGASG